RLLIFFRETEGRGDIHEKGHRDEPYPAIYTKGQVTQIPQKWHFEDMHLVDVRDDIGPIPRVEPLHRAVGGMLHAEPVEPFEEESLEEEGGGEDEEEGPVAAFFYRDEWRPDPQHPQRDGEDDQG